MSVVAVHRIPGLVLTDHVWDLPLDPERPEAGTIAVFGREVVAAAREHDDLPFLVFLQGGPGFEAARPMGRSGWIKRAVQGHRLLLLDQRGTGRSSPIEWRTMARLPDDEARARYLACFRADGIVRDAEAVRRDLIGDRPWSVLGQSFGGFCATHYLSAAPEGLAAVYITGGLPGLETSADDVYRATYPLVLDRNERYFARYPEDADTLARLAAHVASREVRLPGGDLLSIRRVQQLGLAFGMSDGFETVHYLVERAFVEGPDGPEPSHAFLSGLEAQLPYGQHPLFAALHEGCYAQGPATGWAAQRVRDERGDFDASPDTPFRFTGEMIYPWMFEEYAALRPFAGAAELLARRDDWPALYDVDRLARNTVPVAAAIYADDMYVPRVFSEETARRLPGARVWVTNEYEHNGLRADGEHVLGRLFDMVGGEL